MLSVDSVPVVGENKPARIQVYKILYTDEIEHASFIISDLSIFSYDPSTVGFRKPRVAVYDYIDRSRLTEMFPPPTSCTVHAMSGAYLFYFGYTL